jgi:hypothetical protein
MAGRHWVSVRSASRSRAVAGRLMTGEVGIVESFRFIESPRLKIGQLRLYSYQYRSA